MSEQRLAGLAMMLAICTSTAANADEAVIDVTPPILTTFDAGATFNLSRATPLFSVLIKGTDNLSGIRSILFWTSGPSAQRIPVFVTMEYPTKSLNRRVGYARLYAARLLQPGVWTIDEATVEDLAGNDRDYGAAALAMLGNTTFTVVNGGTFDAVPPTLTSGEVLTPAISLSTPAQGTDHQAPFAGIRLVVADTGSTALAGIAGAHAAFCIAGNNPCIEMLISNVGGSQATGTLFPGAQVAANLGHLPGVYELCDLGVWDQAGNMLRLASVDCDGTTDFSLYFPTTTITLTP
jgi:hypothetical protein